VALASAGEPYFFLLHHPDEPDAIVQDIIRDTRPPDGSR
jgi:hypothetical protein